jgi:uncharacterized protein YecE (DUF72 family)
MEKMNLRIGAAGWSYDDWKDVFYPKSLSKGDWLQYYAKYFDFVEVNSTFYNILNRDIFEKWNVETPDNFRFSIKMWQNITHKFKGRDLDEDIDIFHSSLHFLRNKIYTILVQSPPFFKKGEHTLIHLKNILNNIQDNLNYVFEFRHSSWFEMDFLKENFHRSNAIVGTSYIDKVSPYYIPDQKKYYVRMIGDRELQHFSHTQRKQKESMDDLVKRISKFSNETQITDFFVIFNNHFRGFSPSDINELKKRLNLKYKSFSKNKNLLDFI